MDENSTFISIVGQLLDWFLMGLFWVLGVVVGLWIAWKAGALPLNIFA